MVHSSCSVSCLAVRKRQPLTALLDLLLAAALLGVNKDALEHALTTRSRTVREGVIVSPLNVRAAQDNRCVAVAASGVMQLVALHSIAVAQDFWLLVVIKHDRMAVACVRFALDDI